MSKPCPLYKVAIYADCLECDTKECKHFGKKKYKQICIGIDQSYKNCGISLSADGELKKVSHIDLQDCKNNTERREKLVGMLDVVATASCKQAEQVICIIERIRLQSRGFVNINYIKGIGALNACIVDLMSKFNISVYSVDTRCWKAQVVGTSKPQKNTFGVPDEKWPTVLWTRKQGFNKSILRKVKGRREKGTFLIDGEKYEYDNDASDSAAISMFWFVGDKDKLQEEH